MTDIAVFNYSDVEIRTVVIEGQPWFVAADVCAVLGIGNPRQAVSYLDEDEKGVTTNDTPGGPQQMATINEPGLYSLILRSRKPEAKAFKRWITHEVIPAIRKTGRYDAAPAIPQTYAEALQLAADQARQIEAQSAALAEAAPKVEAWDHLASADGDYAVADAAKILSRHPLIKVGRDRLFALMAREGWIYRRQLDNRWTVYQRAVDTGWLTELASSHYHPRTGELVLDPPQVRVRPKGLAELQKRLTGTQQQIEAA
jgi:prophage antirepressor-like protein